MLHRILALLFVAALVLGQHAPPPPSSGSTSSNNAVVVPRHVVKAAAHSPRADPACQDDNKGAKAKSCTDGKAGRTVSWRR